MWCQIRTKTVAGTCTLAGSHVGYTPRVVHAFSGDDTGMTNTSINVPCTKNSEFRMGRWHAGVVSHALVMVKHYLCKNRNNKSCINVGLLFTGLLYGYVLWVGHVYVPLIFPLMLMLFGTKDMSDDRHVGSIGFGSWSGKNACSSGAV